MGIKKEESMDYTVAKAVIKAFNQMIANIENEPGLILEGEEIDDMPDSVIEEIEAWLFERRKADGNTDNSTDK